MSYVLRNYQKVSQNFTHPLRIFLVRHGESCGNVNMDLFAKMADCDIPLSGLFFFRLLPGNFFESTSVKICCQN